MFTRMCKRLIVNLLFLLPLLAPAQHVMDSVYLFQHRLLPNLFYRSPDDMRRFLAREQAPAVLAAMAEAFPNPPDSARMVFWSQATNPYFVRTYTEDDLTLYVLNLPEPRKTPHCYQVAFLFKVPADTVRRGWDALGYYTLEKGLSLGGESYNPICGWIMNSGGSSHRNFGITLRDNYDAKAFAQAVFRIHRKAKRPKAGVDLPASSDGD